MLPGRDPRAEDDCVARWSSDPDIDGLIDVIDEAMKARRPRLAARLVGLLDEDVDAERGSPIARARNAARMLLHHGGDDAPDAYFSALEEAWKDSHRDRFERIKRRMRQRVAGKTGRAAMDGRKKRRKR